MVTRSRASNATATAAQSSDALPSSPQVYRSGGLTFSEPISWKVGRTISVTELHRRLDLLSKELISLDQHDEHRDSFLQVAKELASPNLLAHKDKGVRALTGACLVDILRLCAPDAPYTTQQLKDIFKLFIESILPALSDPSDAYNSQHMHVLKSLAEVKSIVLLTDLPQSDNLVTQVFTRFFDVISGSSKASSGEQLAKTVGVNMTAILAILTDESATLPQEAVDTIVAQFLRVDPKVVPILSKGKTVDEKQPTLAMKELPPAYNMAKTICSSCPEKMAAEISKYFADVILDASTATQRTQSGEVEDPDESLLGPSEEDLQELRKAHRLLRELWRACPAVLQNVIPQLEAELSAENIQLRLLATETLGDIVSGIGAAGSPPPSSEDPAAWPPIDLSAHVEKSTPVNILTAPSSPQSFPQHYVQAYSAFLSRRQDKSALVRAAWTTAIGSILGTNGGGIGLSPEEESRLVDDLARMLNDSDEKVRTAAVQVIGRYSFRTVINLFGSSAIDTAGSVMANLSERVKDKRHAVRVEAMTVLSRIWGLAVGEISVGNQQVISCVGNAPSKILNTYYTNDQELWVLMDQCMFEILVPLGYPPIKARTSKEANGSSQRIKDSQKEDAEDEQNSDQNRDPDTIRVERMLLLLGSLDEKARKVFYSLCQRQARYSGVMRIFLDCCEQYNAGVMDEGEKEIQERLTRIIQQFCKFLPNSSQVSTDLWKFARNHDRRGYQLIRFAMATDSDYRTVFKAIKEFKKRLDSTGNASLLETLTPLLYWTSNIMYNRSHVPAIISYAKSNEKGLSAIAHDLLKDISSHSPEVLKAHVKEMCQSLQEYAPSGTKENSTDALDNLKACAAFAKRFPEEIPQDRKFTQAMVDFAMHGSPAECAKHAVSIIMASSAKKEMLARDLVKKCIEGSEYGKPGFLARLATLSQLCLLAPTQIDSNGDKVIDIAIEEHLTKNREPSKESRDAYHWSDTNDEECEAKCWAMKIVVNRVRSHPSRETLPEVSKPVYNLLHTLIEKEGELSTKGNTPASHKPRLRLLAARSLLKLSLSKDHEALLTPLAFNKLAEVAQDSEFQVRASFLARLKKYLGHNSIPSRFYTILFLLAFEPEARLKVETTKWIRSRAAFFAGLHSQASGDSKTATNRQTVLEGVFARLLSLLAHHPDYGPEMEDLLEFSRYLVFYLTAVATAENASLIYHIAQRVKGCTDAVLLSSALKEAKRDQIDEISSRLPIISDLATCTTRAIIEAHGWSLQTLPSMAKMQLPRSLFMEIKDHQKAMKISEKSFLPEGVVDTVENIVRNALRHHKSSASSSRKRKSDGWVLDDGGTHKKVKKIPFRPTGEGDKLPKSAKKTSTRRKSREWDDAMDEDDEDDDEEPKKRSEAKPSRKSERTSIKGVTYVEESDEEEEEAGTTEIIQIPEDGEDESEAAETILVVSTKEAVNSKKKGKGSKSAILSSANATPSKPPPGRAQRSTRSTRE